MYSDIVHQVIFDVRCRRSEVVPSFAAPTIRANRNAATNRNQNQPSSKNAVREEKKNLKKRQQKSDGREREREKYFKWRHR